MIYIRKLLRDAVISDNSIGLEKLTEEARILLLVGREDEQSTTGTIEEAIIECGFSKVVGCIVPEKLQIIASLKTSDAWQGSLKFYIDAETTPRLVLNTISTTYVLLNGEFNVDDLAEGRHKLTVKMCSSVETGVVSNDYIEIYLIRS